MCTTFLTNCQIFTDGFLTNDRPSFRCGETIFYATIDVYVYTYSLFIYVSEREREIDGNTKIQRNDKKTRLENSGIHKGCSGPTAKMPKWGAVAAAAIIFGRLYNRKEVM